MRRSRRRFFVGLYENDAGILAYFKEFSCKITENMQAIGRQRREQLAEKSVEKKPVVSYTASGSGKVKLKWTKVKGATKYRVCKLVGNTYTTVKKSTKKNSYTITGLTAGNVYKYGVKAYVNGKWTSLSVAEAISVQAK